MTGDPTPIAARTHWPLFGLRVRTPDLELRVPTDEQFHDVCDLAIDCARGARQARRPVSLPFPVDDTSDLSDPDALRRAAFQFLWGTRAGWTPASWQLQFVVHLDGQVIGTTGLRAVAFDQFGEASSGSWLARRFQGRGFGTQMRAGLLHLAFGTLGARWATSQVLDDGPASLAVNRHHGYESDGFELRLRDGVPVRWLRYRLAAERWWNRHPDAHSVAVEGFEACRFMFDAPPGTRRVFAA